ncbi:MAG: winged helix-turn-helix domain-containing protein [Candidatus Eremiobacteraeota bacterium]|nr:winged helix-turn-helix domain-containing protein [Candidatus Eremiobacteraeota bacterium]
MAQETLSGAPSAGRAAVIYRFGAYEVDGESLTLRHRGTVLPLAPKVVKTLVALLDNAGRVVSKDELLQTVWNGEVVDEANLSQNIYTLRRTFEAHGDASFIETLSRRGYRFVAGVSKGSLRPSPRSRPVRLVWLGAAAAVVLCAAAATRVPHVGAAQAPVDRQLSAAATQQYALGWYYWRGVTESSLRASLRHFELTADASPSSPLGFAGEAAAYAKLADVEEGSPSAVADAVAAGRLARRALALDGGSPEAIAVKGYIEFDLDGDNAAAAADLRRAVALAPDFPVAHLWYGAALLWQGEPKPARAELERAASLDSRLPGLYYLLALDYYMSRDYGNAVAFGKLATADDWTQGYARFLLAAAHDEAGQYASAIRDLKPASSSISDALAVSGTLAHVYAAMGKQATAKRELRAVELLSSRFQQRPVLTAIAYAANERPDEAFAWLSRLPRSDRRLFALDPRLDTLRRDPRFSLWLHG